MPSLAQPDKESGLPVAVSPSRTHLVRIRRGILGGGIERILKFALNLILNVNSSLASA